MFQTSPLCNTDRTAAKKKVVHKGELYGEPATTLDCVQSVAISLYQGNRLDNDNRQVCLQSLSQPVLTVYSDSVSGEP